MMAKRLNVILATALLAAGALSPGLACAKDAKGKPVVTAGRPDATAAKPAKPVLNPGKPALVVTYNDWGVYVAQGGKERTCYALSRPKDRQPASLKRDPAYIFISTRPSENVRNEISVILGFPMKEGGDASAEIGDNSFDLVGKGPSAWVKNPAEEGQLIDALKKGARLILKAPSIKGNVTTDTYSLSGLSPALDRVAKDCK